MKSVPISEICLNGMRITDAAKVSRLETSITKWGQIRPILVCPKDTSGTPYYNGKYLLLDGVHRHTACKRLGLTTINIEVYHDLRNEV